MSLVSTVMKQLGNGGLTTIASTLNMDKRGAKSAVSTAVSVLTGVLAHNASQPQGAQAIDAALARDHDGSIFDNLGGFLGNFGAGEGAGILGHILGGAQPQVQQQIAQKSGLSLEKIGPLLVMVAPLVMGALGKMKRDKKLDATAVATTLDKERRTAQKKDSNDVLGSVLGMLGAGTSSSSSSSSGGLGGILGALGGLLGKKGK